MSRETKTLTVRLPLDLYKSSSEIAKRRRVSLNALVQEGLSLIMKSEEYNRLYEAFGQLGEDAEELEVGFAAHVQWEIVKRDDN